MRLDSFTRRRWLTAYAPLIIWTVFTLGLGSGAASMNETSRFIRPLLEFLFPSADADTLYMYHAIIRKMAHLFQYGVLGLLAIRAFASAKYRVTLALLFAVLVATIDEVNQSFDPTRTSTVRDVVLDVFGSVAALVIYILWVRRKGDATRHDQISVNKTGDWDTKTFH